MKIIVVADVHGSPKWKALKTKKFDKIIFLGDYFDSREGITFFEQIDNFKEIMEWRKSDPRVITLVGNHDYHYFKEVRSHYSGYQFHMAVDITEVVETYRHLLDVVHIEDKYLFSHAGVTKTWLNSLNMRSATQINDFFKVHPGILEFNGHNPYGDDITQGPTWVRPKSLIADRLPGFMHVVGHTHMEKPICSEEDNLILCDSGSKYFVVLENDEVRVVHAKDDI